MRTKFSTLKTNRDDDDDEEDEVHSIDEKQQLNTETKSKNERKRMEGKVGRNSQGP